MVEHVVVIKLTCCSVLRLKHILVSPQERRVVAVLNGHTGRVNAVQWVHRQDSGESGEAGSWSSCHKDGCHLLISASGSFLTPLINGASNSGFRKLSYNQTEHLTCLWWEIACVI